jgi:hypothetical protein
MKPRLQNEHDLINFVLMKIEIIRVCVYVCWVVDVAVMQVPKQNRLEISVPTALDFEKGSSQNKPLEVFN